MPKLTLVAVPAKDLEILKSAAWLWSCESPTNADEIRSACRLADRALAEQAPLTGIEQLLSHGADADASE